MGDTFAFSSELEIISGRGKRSPALTKRPSMTAGAGGSSRKALLDVTNTQRQMLCKPDRKQPIYFATTKDYIDRLQEENLALKKQLVERDKIIELSGIELEKLQVALQMMQQQNRQLAQANSQLSAELDAGKDRVKVMEHELGCVKCLLTAKNLEEEDKTRHVQQVGDEETVVEGAGDTSAVNNNENNPSDATTGQLSRGTALCTSTAKDAPAATEDASAENSEINRKSKRRQSSRLNSKEVSNEYLSAELDVGEDRVKVTDHELGCLKCPLTVKNLEVEDKTRHVQQAGDEEVVAEGGGDTSAVNNNYNPSDATIGQLSRSTALCTSTAKDVPATVKDAAADNSEINRKSKRRRSSRLNSKEVSNEYLSAELDAGEDRVKLMEQDLGCLECPLTVKNLEEEDKTRHVQQAGDEEVVVEGAGDTSAVNNNEKSLSDATTGQLPRDLCASTAKDVAASVKDAAAGNSEIDRKSKRRRSSRLNSKEVSNDHLSETDSSKCPLGSEPIDATVEDHSLVPNLESNNDKDPKVGKTVHTRSPPIETKTSSRQRPLRRAAEKVQTYKEIPLNAKLRRTE